MVPKSEASYGSKERGKLWFRRVRQVMVPKSEASYGSEE